MNLLCDKGGAKKEKRDVFPGTEEEEEEEKATIEAGRNLVDFKAHLQSKGLDFDAEWRVALKENLAMMQSGEQDMRRVDDLVETPPRGGLRHNATKVG